MFGEMKKGQLMFFNEETQEWEYLAMGGPIEMNDLMEELKRTQKQLDKLQPKITKAQAKKLLKHEKNPMARKELNRIISSKNYFE